MNINEAFDYISSIQPAFIHISGKTSTGKSTFAKRLHQNLGYEIVELDTIVYDAVIEPQNLTNHGHAYFEVYKQRNELAWISSFVSLAEQTILDLRNKGSKIVIDGAVANMATLKELLSPFSNTLIIYLHPASIKTYESHLTNRFELTTSSNHAGLPLAFWQLIPEAEFQKFCENRKITPPLSKAIEQYAIASQKTSEARLREIKANFENLLTVEV